MIFLVVFAIKIAVIYYFIKYLIFARGCLNKIFVLFMIFFYALVNFFSVAFTTKKHVYNSPREKACYSNIRVITGAVEMYNMDVKTLMTTLDTNTLLEKKYIKPMIPPEKDCEYHSEGNIAKDGYIYCKRHGDIEGLRSSENQDNKQIEEPGFIEKIFSRIWSYEEKIDDFFFSILNKIEDKLPRDTVKLFLFFIGLTQETFNCAAFLTSLLYLFLLTHIKKEDEEGVVYEEVYSSEEDSETNPEIANNNSEH